MEKWVVEFLNETVEAEFECLPAEARAKTIHISKLIREFGLPDIGLPYIRHVQDKIWEIRALQGRSLYITMALQWQEKRLSYSDVSSKNQRNCRVKS
jgi:hypothetical protein